MRRQTIAFLVFLTLISSIMSVSYTFEGLYPSFAESDSGGGDSGGGDSGGAAAEMVMIQALTTKAEISQNPTLSQAVTSTKNPNQIMTTP